MLSIRGSGGEFKLFLQVASSCQCKHMSSMRIDEMTRGERMCARHVRQADQPQNCAELEPHQGQDNGPFIELQPNKLLAKCEIQLGLPSTTRNSSSLSSRGRSSIAHLLMLLKLQPRELCNILPQQQQQQAATKGSSKHNHFNLAKSTVLAIRFYPPL